MGAITISEIVQVPKEVAERLEKLRKAHSRADWVFLIGFSGSLWFIGMMAYATTLKPFQLLIVWCLVLLIPCLYSFPVVCGVIREQHKIYKAHGWSGRTPAVYSVIEH